MMLKLVALFCLVDDFCQAFLPEWNRFRLTPGTQKRNRPCRMSSSEIMTIIIAFHLSHYRNFKHFYLNVIGSSYRHYFPLQLSYNRFIEVMSSVLVPLSAFFTHVQGKPTGIEFIDSTSLKVCHNLRIPRHKVFKGVAARGKGTMGWFYGFKLHIITNHLGEIVAAKLTPGNTDDRKPVRKLSKGLIDKLYADKGYISKALSADLADNGVTLITNVKKNMKAKAHSAWDKAMLSRRFIIETINDQLKNISQIEHSRHRSIHGFMLNLLGGLVAYCVKPNKPSLNITDCEKSALIAMA